MVRNNHNNVFDSCSLTNKNTFTLNTQAVNDDQVITKSYVYQFRNENEKSRKDLGIDFMVNHPI